MMKIKHTIAALAATALAANAAISLTGDSSTFDYLYEMDVDPTTQNQDSLGAEDWFNGPAGSLTSPTVSGGVASSDLGAAPSEQLWRGDFNAGGAGSVWRELVSDGAASDWTLELSVQKTGGTQGSSGWFGIATANSVESNSSALTILDDRIRLTGGADYMVGTVFSTGFHTIRIAHDAVDNAYYYWINGTLLNADLSTAIAGTNGSAFDNNAFIGNYSSSFGSGEWDVDYLRIDTDAIAAVPEPSSTALLGLAGLALILRRRK
ncbi:MAG: PEP-CTERM sorting domain-containing protein [Akkermansiaceae bacterium]